MQKETVYAGFLLSDANALSSPRSPDVVLGERVLRMLISCPKYHRIPLTRPVFMFGTIEDTPNIIRTGCNHFMDVPYQLTSPSVFTRVVITSWMSRTSWPVHPFSHLSGQVINWLINITASRCGDRQSTTAGSRCDRVKRQGTVPGLNSYHTVFILILKHLFPNVPLRYENGDLVHLKVVDMFENNTDIPMLGVTARGGAHVPMWPPAKSAPGLKWYFFLFWSAD